MDLHGVSLGLAMVEPPGVSVNRGREGEGEGGI